MEYTAIKPRVSHQWPDEQAYLPSWPIIHFIWLLALRDEAGLAC